LFLTWLNYYNVAVPRNLFPFFYELRVVLCHVIVNVTVRTKHAGFGTEPCQVARLSTVEADGFPSPSTVSSLEATTSSSTTTILYALNSIGIYSVLFHQL
jgi:hypothetical protein